MEAAHFVTVNYFGYPVHVETVMVSWGIMLLSLIFFLVLKTSLRKAPGRVQAVMEMAVEYFNKQAVDLIGPGGQRYTPVIFFIFFAVLLFNLVGLLPSMKLNGLELFAPPTRDINTTLAFAISSFVLFNYYGVKKKGLGYFKHFIEPAPEVARSLPPVLAWIMVPPMTILFVVLNFVEIFARVLSLTVRLFSNIMSEHIIAASLIMFMFVVMKIAVVAGIITYGLPLFVFMLSVMTSVVQAFIFAILTLSYISTAVVEEH